MTKAKPVPETEIEASGKLKRVAARPARGVRVCKSNAAERAAARRIVAAHAPANELAKGNAETIPVPKAEGRVHPAPRAANAAPFGSHQVNSGIARLLRDSGFTRTTATNTETTLSRADGATVTTRTGAAWTLSRPGEEPAEGKGAATLATLVRHMLR